MPYLEFQGKQIEIDEDGYVVNLDDWTKDLATFISGRMD